MFCPEILIHPGESIKESLETTGMTVGDIAEDGLSAEYIQRVIDGKDDILPTLAVRLENMGWASREFWMNLQMNYYKQKAFLVKKLCLELAESLRGMVEANPHDDYKDWERRGVQALGALDKTEKVFGVTIRTQEAPLTIAEILLEGMQGRVIELEDLCREVETVGWQVAGCLESVNALYDQNLQAAYYHLNGDLEPFDPLVIEDSGSLIAEDDLKELLARVNKTLGGD